jgi:predicted nucleic acid-binding protein
MSARFFIDTNVFVYAYDSSSPSKEKIALGLILDAIESEQGCISYQVVQEFCNVMLKNDGVRTKTKDLPAILNNTVLPLLQPLDQALIYLEAVELYMANKLQFYDALIIQSAIYLKCDILYSEDLQDGRKFGKLTIKNPFK